MIIDLAHWINVVLASINIKGCRISRVCMKGMHACKGVRSELKSLMYMLGILKLLL
jgi:hypothetical protein